MTTSIDISKHPIYEMLSSELRERTNVFQRFVGRPIVELADELKATPQHLAELNQAYKDRKGSMGIFIEQLLIGVRGNNKTAPDDGIVEIKCIAVPTATKRTKYQLFNGYAAKENLRLSKINYDDVQHTPFINSSIYQKRFILLAIVEYSKTKLMSECAFIGFVPVDLTSYLPLMEQDYNVVRNMCRAGNAWQLSSATNQQCAFMKTYSNGNSKTSSKYTENGYGIERYAKPKSFYIFKNELMNIINKTALDYPTC